MMIIRDESVEAVVELFFLQLWGFRCVDFSVEWVISVESISIFRAVIISLQNGVWFPTLIVKISVVCGKSTSFCFGFLGLQPFTSLPVRRIKKGVWSFEGLMRGRTPFSLN
jgi:hypothetical protein